MGTHQVLRLSVRNGPPRQPQPAAARPAAPERPPESGNSKKNSSSYYSTSGSDESNPMHVDYDGSGSEVEMGKEKGKEEERERKELKPGDDEKKVPELAEWWRKPDVNTQAPAPTPAKKARNRDVRDEEEPRSRGNIKEVDVLEVELVNKDQKDQAFDRRRSDGTTRTSRRTAVRAASALSAGSS